MESSAAGATTAFVVPGAGIVVVAASTGRVAPVGASFTKLLGRVSAARKPAPKKTDPDATAEKYGDFI